MTARIYSRGWDDSLNHKTLKVQPPFLLLGRGTHFTPPKNKKKAVIILHHDYDSEWCAKPYIYKEKIA